MAYQEPITKDRLLKFIKAYSTVEVIPVENNEPIFILKNLPNFKWECKFLNQKIIIHKGNFIWESALKVPMSIGARFFNREAEDFIDKYRTYDDYPNQIAGKNYDGVEFSTHNILLNTVDKRYELYTRPLLRLLKRFGILEEIKRQISATPITPKEKKDYGEFKYKCSYRIFISGETPKKRSNEVSVDGRKTGIADNLFIILLQLIVGIKNDMDGWVHINMGVDKYQKLSNLRAALKALLSYGDELNFIENEGSKRYRISTHPNYVTYNKKKLLKYPILEVQELAKKLP